jgi:hypothetical protein
MLTTKYLILFKYDSVYFFKISGKKNLTTNKINLETGLKSFSKFKDFDLSYKPERIKLPDTLLDD